jgi:hypothetical protein
MKDESTTDEAILFFDTLHYSSIRLEGLSKTKKPHSE